MTTEQILAFASGAGYTILLTVVSVFFGSILGLLLALFRVSKSNVLNGISWFYIWIFRGTPLFMQIMVIYYALPIATLNAFGNAWTLGPFQSATLALSLNTAAYLAETIRGAIQSIDKGQMEAATALGMSYNQAMFKIIIPQSYRRLLPPVGNEFIMLLKDSSLVSAIGMTETLRVARVMANGTGRAVYYLYAAAIYLALTTIFTLVFQKLEKKYSAYE